MSDLAAQLNADCRAGLLDNARLKAALRAQGEDFLSRIESERPHLFANTVFFVSQAQLTQMRAVITAVEQTVATAGWRNAALAGASVDSPVKGVFFGYDFHLNADGAHLIEINTNAGGAFLNVLLLQSQQDVTMPGTAAVQENIEPVFLGMFRNEWKLARGDETLQAVAIVDEQPTQQYLYPEFVLAQRMFERAGIAALIADPSELEARGDGLYCGGRKIDLIYNRLTDFSLQHFPLLESAHRNHQVVLTPHPQLHALYSDKRNLARLTDAEGLRAMGVAENIIAILLAGIPQTRIVQAGDAEHWWAERKQWFFKPAAGFGGKATYRGANITKRVFEEIMHGDYVAQLMAPPGERGVCAVDGSGPVAEAPPLKSDVRCYVYDGEIQLVAARLYQGQTTNFRTPGGGFAPVRVVE